MSLIYSKAEELAFLAVVAVAAIPPEKIFPSLLIVLDIAAAVVAFQCGDVRRSIYWTAAAILTASVTF